MNSTDLPITDWWDPDWGVYDVPSSPYDVQEVGDTSAVTEQHWMVWWTAYDHNAEVVYIMTGSRWGWPDNLLTRQLTRHAYPGQPSTRTRPPVKPCTCEYRPPDWWLIEGSGVVMLAGSRFMRDPACPHHGLPRPSIEELWNDPALNVMRDPYDLDDDERR